MPPLSSYPKGQAIDMIMDRFKRACSEYESDLNAIRGWVLEVLPVLCRADSELSAIAHGRPADKAECDSLSADCRLLCEQAKSFRPMQTPEE